MDLSRFTVEIKRHAFIRALEHGIHPDHIEDVIKHGKMDRYGKNGIQFRKKGQKRTIICVGDLKGTAITIFTIEEASKK